MFTKKTATAAALLALCLSALLTAPAQAQRSTDLQRVEVSGQPTPRTDVAKACPDIGGTLQRSLARVVHLERRTGTVNVDFSLHEQAVTQVSSQGGPFEYHAAIRRAVRSLDCQGSTQAAASYRFQIAFTQEDAAEQDGPRVAVLLPRH